MPSEQRIEFQRIWQATERAALASPPLWCRAHPIAEAWREGRDAAVEHIREELEFLKERCS